MPENPQPAKERKYMTNGQIPWDASGEGPSAANQPQPQPQPEPQFAAVQPVPPLPTPAAPQPQDYAQPQSQQAYPAQPIEQPAYQPGTEYTQQPYYAQPGTAAATPNYGTPYGAAPANNAPYPVKPKMNTMAVVGFIFSFLISIVGLILCIIAKNQIKTRGERGDGLATAGIIISVVSMLLAVIIRMYMGSSSNTYSSTVLVPMLFGFLG